MHVDEFIDTQFQKNCYARFVLLLFRLPGALSLDFEPWIKRYPLFCTYKEERYRCTGASRLGDVWLTKDFNQTVGYQLRVDVEECGGWSDK